MKFKILWDNRFYLPLMIMGALFAKDPEIIALTESIGFTIDAAENKFYGIFPDIPGFESAQIYEISRNRFEAKITFVEFSQKKFSRRSYNLRELNDLQMKLIQMPEMTLEDRKAMGADFTYLRTDEILSSIPKGQYVNIKHRSGKRIKGTLLAYTRQNLILQTPLALKKVSLGNMERITYREKIISRPKWKLRIYGVTAFLGVLLMESWNIQTRPRTEMKWHNRFLGAAFGTLTGAELYNSFLILATPKSHFGLTPTEMDQMKKKLFVEKEWKKTKN